MRRNGALVIVLLLGACADRTAREEPGYHRLARGYGPADGPMLLLEIHDEPVVHGCDDVAGDAKLLLAFDVLHDDSPYELTDSSSSWGRFVTDDGEELDVAEASLVIVSREDGLAHVSYTAVVPGRPEMSDELVDVPDCPAPPWG